MVSKVSFLSPGPELRSADILVMVADQGWIGDLNSVQTQLHHLKNYMQFIFSWTQTSNFCFDNTLKAILFMRSHLVVLSFFYLPPKKILNLIWKAPALRSARILMFYI